jgi:hypothetical protein
MLETLWQTVGVQRDVIKSYAESSQHPRGVGLEHTCVVGVPDPIDAIPYGHVFVPGLGADQNDLEEIFVTRFPCTAASDARMLPLVTERPQGMSTSDWNFLNTLHLDPSFLAIQTMQINLHWHPRSLAVTVTETFT